MKRKKDIRNKYMASIIAVSMIGILVIGLIFFRIYHLYENQLSLATQQELLDEKIKSEKVRQVELNNELDYMESDQYVEDVAREKFGLIKEGEKIIKADPK